MKFFSAIKLILTLHCEESTRLISDGLERDLSFVERTAVRAHFISCRSCRKFRKQLELVREEARRLGEGSVTGAKLSHEARQRIKRAINEP